MTNDLARFCEQLVSAIDAKLVGCFGEIQELELIKALQQPPYQLFAENSLQTELSLFQTHFLVYHALYKLREQWLQDELAIIDIALSRFTIHPYCNNTQTLPTVDDGLRSYYMNLDNVEINQCEVEALLNSFWERFLKGQLVDENALQQAYQVLSLAPSCTDIELKKRIKSLSLTHHPDRGGDDELFKHYQQAYELIKAARAS